MSLKFFTIPAQDSTDSEADLDRFLNSHKVLSVERAIIDQGVN